MVDPWEAFQEEYQRTAVVLDHFDYEINQVLGGVTTEEGQMPCPLAYGISLPLKAGSAPCE